MLITGDGASAFCYAIDQLGDANGHIVGASEAGSAFDFDRAAVEAEQAATDAKEAAEALEFAGVWPPASSAVVYLSSAAEALKGDEVDPVAS